MLIATDADDPGEELARRLRQELGAGRCRRVVFRDGDALFKDANDALKAGWTRERFEAVMGPVRPRSDGDDGETVLVAGEDDAEGPYRLIDGQICRLRHDREGNELVQVLANFDARIFEEVAYDDGAEVVRAFKLRGRLASGTALADARVTAAEFGGMSWVASAWGARALVSAGAGARDHLRAAIQVLSEPNERLVFRHTGWRFHEGRWVYLFQGGGVGAESVTVELDPPLDRFILPPDTEDLRDAVRLSLRILDAAPPSVSIPLLAATYAAPLAFITSPDFALWMVGPDRQPEVRAGGARPAPLRHVRPKDAARAAGRRPRTPSRRASSRSRTPSPSSTTTPRTPTRGRSRSWRSARNGSSAGSATGRPAGGSAPI